MPLHNVQRRILTIWRPNNYLRTVYLCLATIKGVFFVLAWGNLIDPPPSHKVSSVSNPDEELQYEKGRQPRSNGDTQSSGDLQ